MQNASDPRIAFFDSLAENWDGEKPSECEMAMRLTQHAALLGFEHGMDVLEVGCGTGKTTAWLTINVAPGRVTAVDFSPAMIEKAVQKSLPADFICMDVCEERFEDRRFDVVFCFHSFPHFRDQAAALRNLSHALKPSGRLIIMHLAGSEHINGFHSHLAWPLNTDLLCESGQWPELLAAAGLECVKFIDKDDLFFLDAIRR